MGTIEEYERLLKETVTAKRLSGSKIQAITELAMKILENDTQLVSIHYRTHKSLSAAQKIPSFYIFDALARAARSLANKTPTNVKTGKGNAVTFLAKMEGVVDDLVRDMLTNGTSETKEKTKKVLDIWTKANTFPPATLSRLTELTNVKEHGDSTSANGTAASHSQKEPTNTNVPANPDTSTGINPNHSLPAQNGATGGLPPALLALLAQAQASTGTIQTNLPAYQSIASSPTSVQLQSNVSSNFQQTIPSLDPGSLALLQQLAGGFRPAAGGGSTVNAQTPHSPPVGGAWSSSPSLPGPSGSPVSQMHPAMPPHGAPVYAERASGHPDDRFRGGPRDDYRDEKGGGGRYGPGPSFRGSRFPDRRDSYESRGKERDYPTSRWSAQGPGRGGAGGGGVGGSRWDARDRYEARDREYGGPERRRSRSPPPRREGHRGPAPFSPPRHERNGRASPPLALQPGLDEFGRELRPEVGSPLAGEQQSPGANEAKQNATPSDTKPASDVSMSPPAGRSEGGAAVVRNADLPGGSSSSPSEPKVASPPATKPRVSRWGQRLPTVDTPMADQAPTTHHSTDTVTANTTQTGPAVEGGIEMFDFTTFDASNAESWAALGKAWEVTNGRPPTFEEMNQVMMMHIGLLTGGAAVEAEGTVGGDVGGVGYASRNEDAYQSSGTWSGGGGGTYARGNMGGRGAWRGRGRGRGGGGYGVGGEMTDGGGYAQDYQSYAVPTISSEPAPAAGYYDYGVQQMEDEMEVAQGVTVGSPTGGEGGSGGGSGGKMIRVGDRWQWVKA